MVSVLVVDDLDLWRQYICDVLRTQQVEIVGEAADGVAALELAEQVHPTIVVLDVSLRGLDGITVARRIRNRLPDIKIVFVSQERDPEVVRAALKSGASGYVLKFDSPTELLRAINAAISGYRFVSRGVADVCFT